MGQGSSGGEPSNNDTVLEEQNEPEMAKIKSESTSAKLRRLSASGESLYAALNLEKGSSIMDIKRAYQRLALKYHPDKNQDDPAGAQTQFNQIDRAYKILSDERKKDIYDGYGSRGISVAEGLDNKWGLETKTGWMFMFFVKLCLKALPQEQSEDTEEVRDATQEEAEVVHQ